MKVLFAESHNLDRPDPVGSHHYISQFHEKGDKCLWLGPAVSPMHLFKFDRLNRYRFSILKSGGKKVAGIDWIVPFSLLFYYNAPFLSSLYAGRNQYRFCLPPLKSTLGKKGFLPLDLIWCASPVAYSLVKLLPHRVSCLRIADRLDRFEKVPAGIKLLEKELIEKVDLVFATSAALYEEAIKVKEEGVYLLPNGVSEHFVNAGKGELKLPPDFPPTDKNIAVYAGTLDWRLDLFALAAAVEKLKEVHFLLIGPLADSSLAEGLKRLEAKENFTWLGAKKYEELPAYLKPCQVGLIPFKLNDLTEAVNPIKLYEYAAMGLPVVASELRELQQAEVNYYPYADPAGLAGAVKSALLATEREKVALKRFAAEQTWSHRYHKARALIDEKLSGQGSYTP